jgi:hypothetical protein
MDWLYFFVGLKINFVRLKMPFVLPEFLKNKNIVKGKSPSFARILEKYVYFYSKICKEGIILAYSVKLRNS